MTLSVIYINQRRIIGWLPDDELERMWKEAGEA
jgi:hypothetical protein